MRPCVSALPKVTATRAAWVRPLTCPIISTSFHQIIQSSKKNDSFQDKTSISNAIAFPPFLPSTKSEIASTYGNYFVKQPIKHCYSHLWVRKQIAGPKSSVKPWLQWELNPSFFHSWVCYLGQEHFHPFFLRLNKLSRLFIAVCT